VKAVIVAMQAPPSPATISRAAAEPAQRSAEEMVNVGLR
jgi:hypothetical protein